MGLGFQFEPHNIFFRCVEDSNEAIMITGPEGDLVYVNPAWCQIYGYTKDEAIGQTPRLIRSGSQSDEFYREMWMMIRDSKLGYWKGEVVNKAKDGKLIPVFLTITTYRSPSGEIQGYMGIAVDVSYKKELEARVIHQDRLASIGILASGLAHEIGTPLGVVRGRAEFLMMQANDSKINKNLEVITQQIDRISKLIRSLLRVSRSFSDIHSEAIGIVDVVHEVMALVGQSLRADSVDVRIEVPPEMRVRADFGRLEQVMLNLIMNSIHAIRRVIQSGKLKNHFLVIAADPVSGGKTRILVRDSGCGIPPENMKKLFKPFFTTKDIGEGTGLGLAIVAQLVREMEGEISVSSIVDEGATFTLLLPSFSDS
jgi:two-component system, cell cycle sensor histidine kinase and response regulator CckA